MTSVRVMLLLLLLHSVIECVTGQLPFGKIKLPGQSVLSSLLPPSGATISRNDDKYLIKAHVGGNEVKFLKLGLGGEKNSAAALQPAAPAILSSPQVSPDVLVSCVPLQPCSLTSLESKKSTFIRTFFVAERVIGLRSLLPLEMQRKWLPSGLTRSHHLTSWRIHCMAGGEQQQLLQVDKWMFP